MPRKITRNYSKAVRLSKDEFYQVEAAAHAEHRTVSEYLRALHLDHMKAMEEEGTPVQYEPAENFEPLGG